ncbi:MAG: TolC family protein [Planctomycetes bacterium]|nr:TolC family protein [Planctomycetota bacterium]
MSRNRCKGLLDAGRFALRGRSGGIPPGWLAALLGGLALGCAGVREGMWAEHGLPAPDASWSAETVRVEPELAPGGRLSLDAACRIALDRHPDLAASRGTLEASDARVRLALAAYLPQVQVSNGWTRSTSNPSSGAGSASASETAWDDGEDGVSVAAGVDQLVLDFGAARSGRRAAAHEAAAAAHDLEAAFAGALLEVREAFLTHAADRALTEASEATVAAFVRRLTEATRLHEVGRATAADVAKARVDLGTARLDLTRSRSASGRSRLRLNRSMGLEEDPGYEVADVEGTLLGEIGAAEAVAQARESHPGLRAARERMIAAEEGVRSARAGYFPSLLLGGSYAWSGSRLPLVENWDVGPSLQWELLGGFRVPARVREAEALLRRSRATLASLEQQVHEEVRGALLDLDEAAQRRVLAAETAASAEESLRLTAGRYRVGRATILETTDAERSLAASRAEVVRSRFDREAASARLLRAMGLARATEEGP